MRWRLGSLRWKPADCPPGGGGSVLSTLQGRHRSGPSFAAGAKLGGDPFERTGLPRLFFANPVTKFAIQTLAEQIIDNTIGGIQDDTIPSLARIDGARPSINDQHLALPRRVYDRQTRHMKNRTYGKESRNGQGQHRFVVHGWFTNAGSLVTATIWPRLNAWNFAGGMGARRRLKIRPRTVGRGPC